MKLVSFLVGLKTYQQPGSTSVTARCEQRVQKQVVPLQQLLE